MWLHDVATGVIATQITRARRGNSCVFTAILPPPLATSRPSLPLLPSPPSPPIYLPTLIQMLTALSFVSSYPVANRLWRPHFQDPEGFPATLGPTLHRYVEAGERVTWKKVSEETVSMPTWICIQQSTPTDNYN